MLLLNQNMFKNTFIKDISFTYMFYKSINNKIDNNYNEYIAFVIRLYYNIIVDL